LAGVILLLSLLYSPSLARAQPKATLYVYRQDRTFGKTLQPSVYCDGVELVRINNGRFFKTELEAGRHILNSDDKQSVIQLQVESGHEYFLRVDIASGLMKGYGKLVHPSSDRAGQKLRS